MAWTSVEQVINTSFASTPLPIASGGTGAKTSAAALTSLGGTSMTLLWTNANMASSSFSAQTVSLNLSNYTHVMIVMSSCLSNYAGISLRSNVIKIGEQATCFANHWNPQDLGDFWIGTRVCKVSTTGVTFENGAYNYINKSSYAASAIHCVPYKIYGIKI